MLLFLLRFFRLFLFERGFIWLLCWRWLFRFYDCFNFDFNCFAFLLLWHFKVEVRHYSVLFNVYGYGDCWVHAEFSVPVHVLGVRYTLVLFVASVHYAFGFFFYFADEAVADFVYYLFGFCLWLFAFKDRHCLWSP